MSSLRSGINVTIVRSENVQNQYSIYVLQASIAGRKYPLVKRRYSEFVKLWNNLSSLPGGLPTLPGKKMFGKMDSDFVNKRMASLQDALHVLCYLVPAAKSNCFRSFLGLPLFSSSPASISTNMPTSRGTNNIINNSNTINHNNHNHDNHHDNKNSTTTNSTTNNQTLLAAFENHHQSISQQHSSAAAKHGLCSVGMIRHSARLDQVFGCTWSDRTLRPYDTPISDYDLPTRAALKLVSYDFQAVISSPFRRCLQTAAVIANRLGLKVLFVDNRLGEVMHQVKSLIKKQLDVEDQEEDKKKQDDLDEDKTYKTDRTDKTDKIVNTDKADKTKRNQTKKKSENIQDIQARWQYMAVEEAERIAEDSGLLLRWSRNQNKPALDESVQSFVKRCNNATEVIEDAQSTFNVHLLTEELDELGSSIVSIEEDLANARETVARSSEQLLATFCNTLGLGPDAASDRMYEIANEAEQNDLGFTEDVLNMKIPVEVAYFEALATVSPLQRSLKLMHRKQELLRTAVNKQGEDNRWTSACVVTHADLLNQRLQHLEPNALYAPRCCGWFVEDPRTNVVIAMNDLDRIM